MVNYMLNILEIAKELKDEERNLLSIAYKNAVGSRRTAWRAVTAYEMKEKNKVFNSILSLKKPILNNLIENNSKIKRHPSIQILVKL